MASSPASISVEAAAVVAQLPHAIWRADQMASYQGVTRPTGFRTLDAELPNDGWPRSALIELMLQQSGIGEMQLLRPALTTLTRSQRIALVQPPHLPQVAAWASWGLPSERLLWVKTKRTADALWTAEQILRNGSCGALVFWQMHARSEALRRLHLAAQSTETVFWMVRPLASVEDASPSPLRLALRPARGGIDIDIVKRRGPQCADRFFVKLEDMPTAPVNISPIMPTHFISSNLNHALLDRRASAALAT